MTATAYDRVLAALREKNLKVQQTGDRASAQCPAHEDSNPSLSVKAIPRQVLLHCHGGCDSKDVLAALQFDWPDLYDNPRGQTYTYDDGRMVKRSPAKKFYQTGNKEGQPTLYRLSAVREAAKRGDVVWLVEGEKDTDTIGTLGETATTAPMGSKSFHKVDVGPLTGATVKVIVDKPKDDDDQSGADWQQQVKDKLRNIAGTLEFYQAKVGKDAADHIAAGLPLSELEPLTKPILLTKARDTFKSG